MAEGGEHRLDNGLLPRSDVHTLFDRGYLAVDSRHRLLVSPRLREDFCNSDRRLFTGLVITPLRAQMRTQMRAISDIQHWSSWRRLHQGQARRSHYRHRLATELGP